MRKTQAKTRGFTLIELMVVIAIMGLLGTASVGGYRQMQRGMEERGVIDNVNSFMKAAYERAQIDRQPTYVYFWDELLRASDGDDQAIVVGRAVAVRGRGRISRVDSGMAGKLLVDEFGDLEQYDEDGNYTKRLENDSTMRLYQLDGQSLTPKYSTVRVTPVTSNGKADGGQVEVYVTHDPTVDEQDKTRSSNKGRIIQFGYEEVSAKDVTWKTGSVYGLEFLTLELPHGYVFGSKPPDNMDDPVNEKINGIICKVGAGSGVGSAGTIEIYSRRPGSTGAIQSFSIGKSTNPAQDM